MLLRGTQPKACIVITNLKRTKTHLKNPARQLQVGCVCIQEILLPEQQPQPYVIHLLNQVSCFSRLSEVPIPL